jgi:hypothetical protein
MIHALSAFSLDPVSTKVGETEFGPELDRSAVRGA